MPHRPLQLGPDPNRTYLKRWNEMHPNKEASDAVSGRSGRKDGRLQGKPMIDSRPDTVATREEPGHWEATP